MPDEGVPAICLNQNQVIFSENEREIELGGNYQ
jgi:hypothetical protein